MKSLALLIASAMASTSLAGCGGAAPPAAADVAAPASAALQVEDVVADDLTYLREEEKLARDVYLTLGARWGLGIFANISESEQRHMDAVLKLLVSAGLPDPAAGNGVGVFSNPGIAALYEALVAKGLESPVEALVVGATIEDLDLNDLANDALDTQDERILSVYDELQKGSRNHLRSFYGALLDQGVTYEAQFISEELLLQIVTSDRETGGS